MTYETGTYLLCFAARRIRCWSGVLAIDAAAKSVGTMHRVNTARGGHVIPVQVGGLAMGQAAALTRVRVVVRIQGRAGGSISAHHQKTVTTDLGARALRAFSVPSGDKSIVLDLTDGSVGNALKNALTGLCM